MNRGTIWIALIAAITVTCAVTVPAKAVHTSAIKGTTISVGALGQVFVVVDLDDHRKK